MSADQLKSTVLSMADSDDALSEDVKMLILGALESDEMLAEVLRGEAEPIERPDEADQAVAVEPVGAFLKSIEVTGFRGVGPTVRVPLHPGPGLVVIAGRNGSGKSTIAEALEMALTGKSYRWLNRTSVWTGSWRNLHGGPATAIKVEIAEKGVGLTTLGLDWIPGSDLASCNSWVQRAGQKRELGHDSLGWSVPIELYRPLLSYDELSGVLSGKPHELYDKMFVLLGLERITEGRNRLAAVLKQLQLPQAAVKTLTAEVKGLLQGSDDPRAGHALALLAKRPPHIAGIQALVTGSAVAESGSLAALRALVQLTTPDSQRVADTSELLGQAVSTVAAQAGTTAEIAAKHADLLSEALTLHRQHGDQPCPVCGVGRLDADWADRSRAALATEQAELTQLRAARDHLDRTRREARDLIRQIPPLPVVDDPELTTLPTAAEARTAWLAAPSDDLALANHLAAALPPLADSYAAVREQASRLLTDREDLWAPIALRLGEWVTSRQKALEQEPQVAQVKLALDWLKNNADVLRNQRIGPLAERAREIWAALRQESNVGLDAIRLSGENTTRRVELDADVDGVKAGAFGVMSQGELHALALALFLPRATAPESPFRFVVLDDPIQAMDPSKVEGFVAVMQKIAADRQVIVLSHDDRLPSAVRRSGVKAQIYEVTRGLGSAVTITNAFQPSTRYLDDAFAFAKDENVPLQAKNQVIPGLCRMGLETTAHEVYSARSYIAGLDTLTIEESWDDASTLRQRLALALHLDKGASIDAWLNAGSRRSVAFRLCNSGVHAGSTADHVDDVNAVRTAVKDLRTTVP